MLDIKRIRKDKEEVLKALEKRRAELVSTLDRAES